MGGIWSASDHDYGVDRGVALLRCTRCVAVLTLSLLCCTSLSFEQIRSLSFDDQTTMKIGQFSSPSNMSLFVLLAGILSLQGVSAGEPKAGVRKAADANLQEDDPNRELFFSSKNL